MAAKTVMTHKWHTEHCPCKGNPQEPSKRLEARQKEIPSSGKYRMGNGTEAFFRKPGSQNRKK